VRGYANQVREYLMQAGCYFVRHGKGDHDIWFSPITNRSITVDRHIDSRHTANGILKDAGIGKKF
jgi:HicA toxin of bacterial toxin-antitoxin,